MDHIVDHSKYFQDASGAIVALSVVWELLPTADHRVQLELHRLGWKGSALWHRTAANRIAQFSTTVGVVDERHAICLCQVWVRQMPLADATIDLLLREFVERVRERLGDQAILGSVSETRGGEAPDEPVQRRGYSFRADFGARVHHAIPVQPGPDAWHRDYPGYQPVPAPEIAVGPLASDTPLPSSARTATAAGLADDH